LVELIERKCTFKVEFDFSRKEGFESEAATFQEKCSIEDGGKHQLLTFVSPS